VLEKTLGTGLAILRIVLLRKTISLCPRFPMTF
jgi:hypothetical protein